MQVYVVNSARTSGFGCFGVFTTFGIAVLAIEKAYGPRIKVIDVVGGTDEPRCATAHIRSEANPEEVSERLYVAPHNVNAMA